MTKPRDTAGVALPPPLAILLTLVAGMLLDRWLGTADERTPMTVTIGAVLVIVGTALIVSALGLFRRAKTRPEPWQPTSALVASGIYRFTRNPMYLGMLLIYLGLAFAFWSPIAAGLVIPLWAALDRLVVAREEAYLAGKFGAAYGDYKRATRRWL